jgi:hypothetical protein
MDGSTIDSTSLEDLVGELSELETEIAMLEGRRSLALAQAMEIARVRMDASSDARSRAREMELRSIAAEIALATRVNDRTVQRRMDAASRLLDRFPRTLSRLLAGLISAAHASAIVEAGCVLTDPVELKAFEQTVLPRAETDTPARVRAYALQLVERLHPESLTERHKEAIAMRGVDVVEVDDGAAELRILMSSARAHACHDRLARQAREMRAADAVDGIVDRRTLANMQSDIAADILLTGAPTIDPTDGDGALGAIRARLEVSVPVFTLSGADDRGAEIVGRSPIDAETARCLAAGAPGFDRVMIHPISGITMAVDRYRRSEEMARFLRARDRHCRWPGCRRPLRYCQLDHNHERHEGGATEVCNLAYFCTRHHTMKTETPWRVRQLADGALEFTSPLGRSHVEEPPPRVVFMPSLDPPPF